MSNVSALLCASDGSPLAGVNGMPLIRQIESDVNVIVLPIQQPDGSGGERYIRPARRATLVKLGIAYPARAFVRLDNEWSDWGGVDYAMYREVS